ncbi:hypothetical protein BHM03_00027193 [Ensete ventricosum]|nr:hypothetical protein BHM03_00027193 [Ensete ventricosum]
MSASNLAPPNLIGGTRNRHPRRPPRRQVHASHDYLKVRFVSRSGPTAPSVIRVTRHATCRCRLPEALPFHAVIPSRSYARETEDGDARNGSAG